MIVKRLWFKERTKGPRYARVKQEWTKEGWFLFGFIPLYIRTISHKETKVW